MKCLIVLLVVVGLMAAGGAADTYTWSGSCKTLDSTTATEASCWTSSDGTTFPGPSDTVVFGKGEVNVASVVTNKQAVYGPVWSVAYATVTVGKDALVTVGASVAFEVSDGLTIDAGGNLTICGYVAAVTGAGDISVAGALTLSSGMISGDGSVTVEDGGSLDIKAFNVSINSYPGYPSNETYIMRDITVNAGGSMLSERLSIVHFGFWWQPHNVTIELNDGSWAALMGVEAKMMEGGATGCCFPTFGFCYPYTPDTINVNKGAILYTSYDEMYGVAINNAGTLCGYVDDPYYSVVVNNDGGVHNYTCTGPNGPTAARLASLVEGTEAMLPISDQGSANPPPPPSPCDLVPDVIVGTLVVDATEWGTHFRCHAITVAAGGRLIIRGDAEIIWTDTINLLPGSTMSLESVTVTMVAQMTAVRATIQIDADSDLTFFHLMTVGMYTNYYWGADASALYAPDSLLLNGATFAGAGQLVFVSGVTLVGEGAAFEVDTFMEQEHGREAFAGAGRLVVGADATLTLGPDGSAGDGGDVIVNGVLRVPSGYAFAVDPNRVIRVGSSGSVDAQGALDATVKKAHF